MSLLMQETIRNLGSMRASKKADEGFVATMLNEEACEAMGFAFKETALQRLPTTK